MFAFLHIELYKYIQRVYLYTVVITAKLYKKRLEIMVVSTGSTSFGFLRGNWKETHASHYR